MADAVVVGEQQAEPVAKPDQPVEALRRRSRLNAQRHRAGRLGY